MADSTGSGFIYGMNDIKITNMAGDTQVDLNAARKLTFTPVFVNDSLKGDDKVVATISYVEKFEGDLESGGITLEAIALLMGKTVTESGSSPNQEDKITLKAGDKPPYVKIYGKALGDGVDGLHVIIKKAKLTAFEAGSEVDTWMLTTCSFEAINDSSGDAIDIIKLETVDDLPTS